MKAPSFKRWLSGTPFARLRKREKWLDYLAALHDAKSVRRAALEVGVHRNTAFRWRHRFLDRVKHAMRTTCRAN